MCAPIIRTPLLRQLSTALVALTIVTLHFTSTCKGQGIPNQFVLADITYSKTHGNLIQWVDLKPATGISLGYLYAPSRNVLFGAFGQWTHFSGEPQVASEVGDSGLQLETTLLQMTAIARLRILKHGFTPYVDVEAGMTFLSHTEAVAPCLGGAIGIQIPIIERLDIVFRARGMWSPQSGSGSALVTSSASLGIVWALAR